MNKKIHFQGMDSSQAIENYANDQLAKVEEFLTNERGPIFIDLTVRPGRPHAHHSAELRIKTAHDEVIVEQEGPAPYQLIDNVIDIAYKKLHDLKKERLDQRKKADSYKGA